MHRSACFTLISCGHCSLLSIPHCRPFSFTEQRKLISVSERIQATYSPAEWSPSTAGVHQAAQHLKTCLHRWGYPPVVRKFDSRNSSCTFLPDEIAVTRLWSMAGDRTVIHIRRTWQIKCNKQRFMESEHSDRRLLRVLKACLHANLMM